MTKDEENVANELVRTLCDWALASAHYEVLDQLAFADWKKENQAARKPAGPLRN